MPTTYRRTNTDSDLVGGADFSKAILPAASDTSNTQAIDTAANSTEDDFGFTDTGVPGASGTTGDYVVEVTVTSGNNAVELDCAVARVNSAGVQQAISSFAGEQTASAGTKTFNLNAVNLGTWVAGDRLRVTYRHRNTNVHAAQSFTIQHGTADSEVVAPWSSAATLFGAVVSPFTFERVVAARVGAKGQIVLPLAFGEIVNGVRTTLGQVDSPFTFGVLTDGTVESSGADWFGEVISPLTFGSQTNGHRFLYILPTADSVDGNWTDQGGGTDLEGAVDDTAVSDSDYIRSELNPAASACRIKLGPVSDPASSSGHRLHWRIAKDAGAGKQVDLTLTLRQGGGDVLGAGTQIAQFQRADVSETFTTFDEALSGSEADAITDYTDLYLELEASVA